MRALWLGPKVAASWKYAMTNATYPDVPGGRNKTLHCSRLSLDTCLHFNLLSVKEHVHLVTTRPYRNVDAMLEEYTDVFSGLVSARRL